MSLTSQAVRLDRVTGVMVVVLLAMGTQAYFSMPQKMDPGFIVRTAQIVTVFPGASPERVEQLVTDPIEQAAQELSELDFVSSTTRTGVSIVAVNIREEFTDVRPIWDDLRRRISSIQASLPEGVHPPEINDTLGDTFPMLFSMTGDGFDDALLAEIADDVRDELLHVDGVARVQIIGEQDERIFVEFSNAQLNQLGLSPDQIQQFLRTRNIIMPGGQIDVGDETIVLEPSGNFGSVEELSRTLIELPGGGLAYLGDITTIRRGYVDPPTGAVTVDGYPGLTFAVGMADGENLVDVGERVRTFFAGLDAQFPHGIDFHSTYFQPTEVEAKVTDFLSNVGQAVGIVLIVMLLSLGVRTGLVVASLIPTAMVITMWVLELIGETINQMSLAALIIALGLLVDNAIVVSESILVRLNKGENASAAAAAACKELQTPLLVSSLTTAAAFLPIFLAESAVGEYTGALFKVVSITLLVSWALAMTMTPLLCVLFLRPTTKTTSEPEKTEDAENGSYRDRKKQSGDDADPFDNGFYRAYRGALTWVLDHRAITVSLAISAFVGSMFLFRLVPAIFFPSQDSSFFMAAVNLPPGSSMAATREMAAEIDEFIETELRAGDEGDGVTGWTTFIGESPPAFTLGYTPSPSLGGYCEMMITTSSVESVREQMDALQRFVLDRFPDASTNIRMLSSGPPAGRPVQVRIMGPDTERVFAIVDTLRARLESISGTVSIDHDWGARVKKLVVDVDPERARRSGLTNADVATALRTYLSGTETTRYREDDESIPVLVRSVAADRHDLDRLRGLSVFGGRNPRGVPLEQVADIDLEWQPSAILRRDRYRTVTLSSRVNGITAVEVFDELRPFLESQEEEWGVGYRWEFGGELESSVKANESIGAKLPIAGLLILLLLVVQFNSLRKTAIVLSTIVLAMIGVAIGLVVMKSTMGFMTLLGIISLAGIVINNAIVLLDRIKIELEENGREPRDAIVEAAQQRVRPILLTTATTVASLIPLYISGGAMWGPMSVAIMFGLVVSTALTLLIVPTLYASFFPTPRPSS